jgi:hypothetical protein
MLSTVLQLEVVTNVIVMVLMLIIADYSRWISSQDVSVVFVGPLFPFPWLSGGCVFLGCVFLRVSPCVLVCNLQTWVSSNILIAWSTDISIGVELCLWALVVKPGVGDYLEDLDIDGTMILNMILKK